MEHWFPGHIARALSEVRRNARLVDVIIEVAVARAPASSRYSTSRPLFVDKRRVLVLTRDDLADSGQTPRWLSVFASSEPGLAVVRFAIGKTSRRHLLAAVTRVARPGSVSCLVVGLPNVGKSTVLNVLAGKRKARTGARPGVTRGVQWLDCPGGLRLLDTPGIVMPRRPEPERMLRLAAMSLVPVPSDEADAVALWIIEQLEQRSPGALARRYEVEVSDPHATLDRIALRIGALLPGGVPDRDRASRVIITDLNSGRLARVTLDQLPGEE